MLFRSRLLTENNVWKRLLGKPSGCVDASIRNSYGLGWSCSNDDESRIEVPSKKELDTESGSVAVIPLALASTCAKAPSAELRSNVRLAALNSISESLH